MLILRKMIDAIRQCRRGAAALEFALLITPYLIVTFGIIEIGLYTLTISVLESSISSSARLIRTGQISTLAPFLTNISSNTFGLVDVTQLSVSAYAYSSFGSIPTTLTPGNSSFNTGSGNSVVVLVVGYQYQFITPLVGNLIAPSGNGAWSFSTTMVFRNEPFS